VTETLSHLSYSRPSNKYWIGQNDCLGLKKTYWYNCIKGAYSK
jgi:hypothetical protein